MTLQTRLAALERIPRDAGHPYEVLLRGGFPKGHGRMEATATGGHLFISELGEGLEEFRARVRRNVGRTAWVVISGVGAPASDQEVDDVATE